MEEYIGIVKVFAGNFAPRGWAFCNGQIMSISQNTALFSILGTTYGGNGQTTFALPNLQGAVAIGAGTGGGAVPMFWDSLLVHRTFQSSPQICLHILTRRLLF